MKTQACSISFLGQKENVLPSNSIRFNIKLLGTTTILQLGRTESIWLSIGRMHRKVEVIHPNVNAVAGVGQSQTEDVQQVMAAL